MPCSFYEDDERSCVSNSPIWQFLAEGSDWPTTHPEPKANHPKYTEGRSSSGTSDMPNKDEKARRKELLHSLRDEEPKKTQAGFPAPILALKDLFDFLHVKLADTDCDDTLRFTRQYLQRNAMHEVAVVAWLEEHGG